MDKGHDLLCSDLFFEGSVETFPRKHADYQVAESVLFFHEQLEYGSVESRIGVRVDLEVAFDYDEVF